MERITIADPAYLAEKAREELLSDRRWIDLPGPHPTPHMYRGMLPTGLPLGTRRIEVRGQHVSGHEFVDHRIVRIVSPAETKK